MILHRDGKEALANVVTNPHYQFLELCEIFLLSSATITPVWDMRQVWFNTCYAGVLHFDCVAPNLFGEGLGNRRVLVDNLHTGVADKVVYEMILPIGYYNQGGASSMIYGMVLVGGADKSVGGYHLSGGVPVYSEYVISGQELIFGYHLFDVPLVKSVNTSVKLQLELQW